MYIYILFIYYIDDLCEVFEEIKPKNEEEKTCANIA